MYLSGFSLILVVCSFAAAAGVIFGLLNELKLKDARIDFLKGRIYDVRNGEEF